MRRHRWQATLGTWERVSLTHDEPREDPVEDPESGSQVVGLELVLLGRGSVVDLGHKHRKARAKFETTTPLRLFERATLLLKPADLNVGRPARPPWGWEARPPSCFGIPTNMVDELQHHSARALLMNDSCTSSPARSLYNVCAWSGRSWPGKLRDRIRT